VPYVTGEKNISQGPRKKIQTARTRKPIELRVDEKKRAAVIQVRKKRLPGRRTAPTGKNGGPGAFATRSVDREGGALPGPSQKRARKKEPVHVLGWKERKTQYRDQETREYEGVGGAGENARKVQTQRRHQEPMGTLRTGKNWEGCRGRYCPMRGGGLHQGR